jgi:hypothetical protein
MSLPRHDPSGEAWELDGQDVTCTDPNMKVCNSALATGRAQRMEGREISECGRGHAVSSDNLYGHTPIASRRWEPVGDLAKTAEDISEYIGDCGSPQATIVVDETHEAAVVRASRDGQEAHARHRCWRDAGAGIGRLGRGPFRRASLDNINRTPWNYFAGLGFRRCVAFSLRAAEP